MNKLNAILALSIVILFIVAGIRLNYIIGGNSLVSYHAVGTSQAFAKNNIGTGNSSADVLAPSVSSAITSSEAFNPNGFQSNYWFNEKFLPGSVTSSQGGYTCNAPTSYSVTASKQICVGSICFPYWVTVNLNSATYSYNSFYGYFGFPQNNAGQYDGLSGALTCTGEGNSGIGSLHPEYPNLASAWIPYPTSVNDPNYCLPTTSGPISIPGIGVANNPYPNSNSPYYPNFINWSKSDIYQYGSSGYYYAVNSSFSVQGTGGAGPAVPSHSTMIVPAISCGSTFPNNYLSGYPYLGVVTSLAPIPAILSVSGFVPSVGLAAQGGIGFSVYYDFGQAFWPGGNNNPLLLFWLDNIFSTFNYNSPTLNYAQFPSGNPGDTAYINVSGFFNTPLSENYFDAGSNTIVNLYESNLSLSSISNLASQSSWESFLSQPGLTSTHINTYTLPNLQSAYYPTLTTGLTSNVQIQAFFRTAAVFPFCNWTGQTANSPGNVLPFCTFENRSSIDPVSYERYWSSAFQNVLDDQPYAPGYNTQDPLNNFTQGELNSFCFYGENFDTSTGVYTSPSYTRIIPPIAAENYLTAIGECNAFFNNTNCFRTSANFNSLQYNSYMNFQDGIFSQPVCTANGIAPKNVTDAWITSLYLANNAGNFCGDFSGQKNLSAPYAGSTEFLQNLSSSCPVFNSNDSSVPLVVTVKNVGNTNMTRPYLVILFNDTNVSQMFHSSNGNLQTNNYGLYENFLTQMQQETTGIIEIRYNSQLQTDMFVYKNGYPLNPVPIQALFAQSQSYEAGPFNNSLLGFWMYMPNSLQYPNVIRASNTFLVHTSSGSSSMPLIVPNGTATFTVEIPMAVFKTLLAGKVNVSVYFGNALNVSWESPGSSPSAYLSGGMTVDPLVSSGLVSSISPLTPQWPPQGYELKNQANILSHNNEFIDPSSSYTSPPWQYLVSYTANFSKKPFSGISIYSDSLNVFVGAASANQSVLVSNISAKVSMQNGTGNYDLSSPAQLNGSTISCFASQENIQDFSVFWSTQAVSAPNLNYAVQNSFTQNNQVTNVIINRWRGLLFSPYADQTTLNYDNGAIYPTAAVSMRLETPVINATSGQYQKEAFVYFGKGTEPAGFANLSSVYNLLSVTPTITPVAISPSAYGFTLIANNMIGNSSIMRIVGVDTLNNFTRLINDTVYLYLYYKGAAYGNCAYPFQTNGSQIVTVNSSNAPCLSNLTATLPSDYVNNSYIVVDSHDGPFYAQMYNTSTLNLGDLSSNGAVMVSSNISNSTEIRIRPPCHTKICPLNTALAYTMDLNVTLQISKGFTLVFGAAPKTTILDNSNIYLYYLNDTPFNCDVVNNIFGIKNNAVASEGAGEYSAPNGSIFCRVSNTFPGIRAVFTSQGIGTAYLGSGDINLGVAVQNFSKGTLYITDNGVPLNSQKVNLTSIPSTNGCNIVNAIVDNGEFNYSNPGFGLSGCKLENLGNYSLSFIEQSNGQAILNGALLRDVSISTPAGGFFVLLPSAIPDNPSAAYALSINTTSALPSSIPVSFSIASPGSSCYDLRLLGQSPYPYAEVPYQVMPSAGQCTYEFILNNINGGNSVNYTLFTGELPSPATYSDSWLNTSSTQYSVFISAKNYSTNLLANCKPSTGPCLDSFSIAGAGVGTLLVNNLSTEQQSTITQTVDGPIVKCFDVSYSASQQVIWPESGFGGVSYNSNKLYQITNPSQAVDSAFCFYNGAPVITDYIFSQGEPLSFNIQNNLISNFSYAQTNSGQITYVPPPKFIGYSGYSTVKVGQALPTAIPLNDPYGLSNSCITNNGYSSGTLGGANTVSVPSSYINSGFYCMLGPQPMYTSESSLNGVDNLYTTQSGETIGLLYRPGVYNISSGGLNSTIYGDCALTSAITSSSIKQGNDYVLSWPQLQVNGTWQNYNPNNAGESNLINRTPQDVAAIFNPSSAGSMIGSCPGNSSIVNYTTCTAVYKQIPPSGGSYDKIESLVSDNNGNLEGGCIINSAYSCEQTNGAINITWTGQKDVTSTSGTATSSMPVYEAQNYPILISSSSFMCSGSVTNTTGHTFTLSCGSGSSAGYCSSSIRSNYLGSGLSADLVASCSDTYNGPIRSQTMTLTFNWNTLSGSQAEPTAPTANFLCGNVSDPIHSNVVSGDTWTPYLDSAHKNLPEVGGCEAGRDIFNQTQPTFSSVTSGSTFYSTYSCPARYSGTIESCSNPNPQPVGFSGSVSATPACTTVGYSGYSSYTQYKSASGPGVGSLPTGCNAFSQPGYTAPTVANGCIAQHSGVATSSNASYALQYANDSGIGIGLGVLNNTLITNISIPPSGEQTIVKDQYMSGLSMSQYEFNTLNTVLYPTNLLLSNLPSEALFKSSVYPYDMLNMLLLQNPFFKVYGIPGFVNGSILDYAMSFFTGGTSANCPGGVFENNSFDAFALGEGGLCSGQQLPTGYSDGIFLSLGALNQGLHAIQFYSVSETGNTSSPTVNLYDTAGPALNLDSTCSNGNQRVFTSKYAGSGQFELNISSDEECNPINNKLYGYIVNCMFQTPGNTTFTTASSYYLAYNLPTLWNVSYTLLVSPKTYNMVPVPVYTINAPFGKYLSFNPAATFQESGLPSGVSWTVTYDGITKSSVSSSISFILPAGTSHAFTAYPVTYAGCTYTPAPSSGNLFSGGLQEIVYTETYCTTTFAETGLPTGTNWSVDMVYKTGPNKPTVVYTGWSTSGAITIVTPPGNYAFEVSSINIGGCSYGPSPNGGTGLIAGSTEYISYPAICETTFIESGLPLNTAWTATYNGTSENSKGSNKIAFSTEGGGTWPYTIGYPSSNAYVTNFLSNTTSIVNGTNNVETSINVAHSPAWIAVAPNDKQVFVSGRTGISVINTSTNMVTTLTPETGAYPYGGVAVSNNGNFLYAATPKGIFVFSIGTTNPITLVSTISLPANSIPAGIALSPNGNSLYVANTSGYGLEVINISSDAVIKTIDLPDANPYSIAVSPDGRYVYVTYSSLTPESQLSIINATSDTYLKTVNLASGNLFAPPSYGVAASPNGKLVYTTLDGDGIAIVNASSYKLINIIGQGNPFGIAVSADGNLLYVTRYNGGSLQILNATSYQSIANLTTGAQASAVALSLPLSSITINGCKYTVIPAAGYLPTGNTLQVNYSVVNCATTFTESSLPPGFKWSVTFDGITGSNSTNSPITLVTQNGTFVASASVDGLTCTAKKTVSTGSYNYNDVAINSWSCITTFTELPIDTGQNFPLGTWWTNYEGTNSTLINYNAISFSTPASPSLQQFSIGYALATSASTDYLPCLYNPSNSSGKIYPGSSLSITYAFSGNCQFTFYESGLPSGAYWDVYLTAVPGIYSMSTGISAHKLTLNTTGYLWGATESGELPQHGVAVSPDGLFTYTINSSSSTLIQAYTATGKVVRTYALPSNPNGVTITPDGKYAYVSAPLTNIITEINLTTESEVVNITFPSSIEFSNGNSYQTRLVATSADTSSDACVYALFDAIVSSSVSYLGLETLCNRAPESQYPINLGTISNTYSVEDLAVSPKLSDQTSQYVSVIGTGNQLSIVNVTAYLSGKSSYITDITLPLGQSGYTTSIAESPTGNKLYVGGSDNFSIIDLSTYQIKTLPLYSVYSLAPSSDGKLLYANGQLLYAINTSSDSVVYTLINNADLSDIAAAAQNNNYVYVTAPLDVAQMTIHLHTNAQAGNFDAPLGTVYTFSVPTTYVNGACAYNPTPNSGKITIGEGSETISYTAGSCYTEFEESGLPGGYNWTVTYDGNTVSSSKAGGNIQIPSPPGDYSATATIDGLSCSAYVSSVQAGSTYTFNNGDWSCTTQFSFSDSGITNNAGTGPGQYTKWYVTYSSANNSAPTVAPPRGSNSITEVTHAGVFSAVAHIENYACDSLPGSGSNGNSVIAGTTVTFGHWGCNTTITATYSVNGGNQYPFAISGDTWGFEWYGDGQKCVVYSPYTSEVQVDSFYGQSFNCGEVAQSSIISGEDNGPGSYLFSAANDQAGDCTTPSNYVNIYLTAGGTINLPYSCTTTPP